MRAEEVGEVGGEEAPRTSLTPLARRGHARRWVRLANNREGGRILLPTCAFASGETTPSYLLEAAFTHRISLA